jgi:Flp pilus assembly protein TadG
MPHDDDHGGQLMFGNVLRRPRRRDHRGQALVEFALVLPILLLLIFGLVDLGRAIYAQNALSEAAREGARYGSVQARSAGDLPGIETYTQDRIDSIPGVTVTATCVLVDSDGTSSCAQNDLLQVEARTDLEMITPIIAQIMGSLGLNPIHLSSTSEVLVNN